MSSADPTEGVSRLSNGTNSAKHDSGPDAPNSEGRPSHLPRPGERVADFVRKYPGRADLPVSDVDGRSIRRDAAHVETVTREVSVEADQHRTDTVFIQEDIERRALPWVEVVSAFLSWYEGYRQRQMRMAKGRSDESDYESFNVDLDNSWSPEYQKRQYAELKALSRETCGGERPSGGESDGRFEEPVAVFLTRSSSAKPGDGLRPPVEHDREIMDAWSDGGVRRSLRYVMDSAGIPAESWVRWSQSEPHPGGGHGTNACFGHTHDMLIIDGAAVEGEITEDMFRPVMDQHVEKAEHAGAEAHGEDSIEVLKVGDGVESPAGYMAKYISVDEDTDLLNRSTEYIAWAAVQWATNSQRKKASDTVSWAVDADACKQRAEDPECEQVRGHGDDVERKEIRGRPKIVCSCCGSPWGIDQDQTLVEARIGDAEGEPLPATADADSGGVAVASDGGVCASPPGRESLSDRWPSATEGVKIDGGEPAEGRDPEPAGVESFEREPEWRVDAIIEQSGEEREPERLGGVDMVDLKLPEKRLPDGVEGIRRDRVRTKEVVDATDPAVGWDVEYVDGDTKVVSKVVGERSVYECEQCGRRSGGLTELECGHVHIEEPGEVVSSGDGTEQETGGGESGTGELPAHVVEWIANNPDASVSAVLGRFTLPPDMADVVERELS